MQGGEVLLALAFALLAGGGAYAVGLALNALAAVRRGGKER